MEWKETEVLEFKKSTSELKEAVISIVAILNKHKNGKVYFGIKNNGDVIGQAIGSATQRDISQAISNHIEPKIYPLIKAVNIKGKSCIKVEFQGEDVPYHAYGRVYIRVADEDKQLSPYEIRRAVLKKHIDNSKWESGYSEYGIRRVNVKVVKDLIRKANIAKRIDFKFNDVEAVLAKLDLIRNGRLLKAAEPLFCNKNSFEVQAAVFAGVDKITFLDINKITGNLFDILEKSEAYVREHINWGVKFGKLEREEIPEIPVKAIREALVNSLCHRDYSVPKGNEIAIFKNRVEIYNPGGFPDELSPKDYILGKERSILRNPLIAEVFYKAKEIEKWGSGIKRIYDECKVNNVKVEFQILKTGFLVVFYRNASSKYLKETAQNLPRNRPETAQKIIDEILKNPYITRGKLAAEIGISEDRVKHQVSALRKQGVLKRIGGDKGGHWEVIK
ncbi:MAG: transcriptional regulator [Candidatus Firestonebacteria bacterium RIFOXYD2_FULL_39_29]|nr:MAG: transcriptional regulator [Candidatus Firestonebacteria bacterium RIFOXYD2_FULL_39_29]